MAELALDILKNTYLVVADAAPYVLFGAVFAGLLQAFLRPESLRRWLSQRTMGSVARASLFGAPLPLCSCSVLPVAMQLRRSGATRGATSSFLISTPQTSVDSVLLSFGLLNPVFAVARVVGAVATGFAAGLVQNMSDDREDQASLKEEAAEGASSCCSSSGSCCSTPPPKSEGTVRARLLAGQNYAFNDLLPSMSKYYVLGFAATGVLMTFLPEGILESYLGGGITGMVVVSIIGVLFYICASAATPLAAVLVAKGMSPGTALVLLLAGPATSLASMVAVRAMLGLRGLGLYLLTIVVCAIGLGLALDGFYQVTQFSVIVRQAESAHGTITMFSHATAVILLILFAYWSTRKLLQRGGKTPEAAEA